MKTVAYKSLDRPNGFNSAQSEFSQAKASGVRRALLTWYKYNGRSFRWRAQRATLYQRIVAETLLQRTQANTVDNFFPAFLRRFPDWKSLAAAKPDEIGQLLKPLGLWQRRAASLSALAQAMIDRRGRFPKTREEIEQLPGIGQYIASAVLLFSRDEPEPLLDVNMARVLERLFGQRRIVDIRYDPHLQSTARMVVRGENAATVNWAVLDLAATICRIKKPLCSCCPVKQWCLRAD